MQAIDWSKCPDAESVPDRVSGQWTVVGTRILADGVVGNAAAVFRSRNWPPTSSPVSVLNGRAVSQRMRSSILRILFDENIPAALRRLIAGHRVSSAYEMG
jgi:hypothetical protein